MLEQIITDYNEAVFDTDRAKALQVIHDAVALGVTPEQVVFQVVVLRTFLVRLNCRPARIQFFPGTIIHRDTDHNCPKQNEREGQVQEIYRYKRQGGYGIMQRRLQRFFANF